MPNFIHPLGVGVKLHPYVEKKRSDARPVMSYDKVFLVKLLDYLRK